MIIFLYGTEVPAIIPSLFLSDINKCSCLVYTLLLHVVPSRLLTSRYVCGFKHSLATCDAVSVIQQSYATYLDIMII